jgi:hypothetical protein
MASRPLTGAEAGQLVERIRQLLAAAHGRLTIELKALGASPEPLTENGRRRRPSADGRRPVAKSRRAVPVGVVREADRPGEAGTC